MQILIIGAGLWLAALAAAARLAWIVVHPRLRRRGWRYLCLWAAMLAVAVALYCRPHEDVFGGEDPGAYINSGVTYAREEAFYHVDPMLATVAPELRPLFYFGHAGYGATKDACLWVSNQQQAILGPRFQPAYPLLMAAAVRCLGTPHAALYVVPLFAIFAALALGVLVGRLLRPRRWAAALAFALFLLNPMTIWHGRTPRPEVLAAFMLFAGLALLVHGNGGRRQRGDVWLGGVCLMLAPFFHVTAWFAVAPALMLIVMLIGAGRRDLLPVPALALLALWGVHLQSIYATDYYGVGHMLRTAIVHPGVWGGMIAAAGLLLAGGASARRLLAGSHGWCIRRVAAWACAGAGMALPAYYYFYRDPAGGLPLLGRPVEHFLYLTDFQAAANMLSLPYAMLALAGWLAWCVAKNERVAGVRVLLALAVLPAVCLAGRMHDFMMTRYLMVAIVPMTALCLTALILAAARVLPSRQNIRKFSMLALAGAVIWLGLYGRMHLAWLTEYRGLARFLAPFAECVRREQGVLLVEYSRLAAPFDHFFGLHVLGIDNERQDDYDQIEAECARMMRMAPDVPVFFMSPFHAPVSERFVFTPVRADVLHYRRLRQAGRSLPVEVRDNELCLTLYRMQLAETAPGNAWDWVRPYIMQFEAGNMGLHRFATPRAGRWDILGLPALENSNTPVLRAPVASPNAAAPAELLMVTMCAANSIQPVAEGWQATALTDAWRVLRGPASVWPQMPPGGADAFIVGVAQAGRDCFDDLPRDALTHRTMPPMQARWTRTPAEIVLPRPVTGTGRLLMLVRAPVVPGHDSVKLTLGVAGQPLLGSWSLAPNAWRWVIAPFNGAPDAAAWVRVALDTAPAWNPGMDGYPPDLGVLVGLVAVLP